MARTEELRPDLGMFPRIISPSQVISLISVRKNCGVKCCLALTRRVEPDFLDPLLLIELLNFVLYNYFFFLNSDSCALPYMSFKRESAKLAEENASQI